MTTDILITGLSKVPLLTGGFQMKGLGISALSLENPELYRTTFPAVSFSYLNDSLIPLCESLENQSILGYVDSSHFGQAILITVSR
ncbi:hypothetical protein RRG08_034520 [Elysia crispata]|uniref:Uncharacterized protein n=1 Tax=Elysia crispata TaxID=231223 RepID=A0AAE1BAS6_9GAST|nr:hypothetical protein RRG08_034520 [Elysia crispata]